MQFQSVPCIRCGKCRGCPMKLDIPEILACYNGFCASGDHQDLAPIAGLPGDRQPKACVGCGVCMDVCPQGIDIPGIMLKLSGMTLPEH